MSCRVVSCRLVSGTSDISLVSVTFTKTAQACRASKGDNTLRSISSPGHDRQQTGEKKKGCNRGRGRCPEKVGFYAQLLSIFPSGLSHGRSDWALCVAGQNGISLSRLQTQRPGLASVLGPGPSRPSLICRRSSTNHTPTAISTSE